VLNVVCVLRSGGVYGVEDVRKLHAMAVRNLHFDEFYCLTDTPIGVSDITEIKLHHLWPGWWSKIELFRPHFPEGSRMLYFDLDTIIVGDINGLANIKGADWVMLGDFYHRPPKHDRIALASGMMMWRANDQEEIYTAFARQSTRIMGMTRGDQQWIARKNGNAQMWETIAPNQVVSYKVHCRDANNGELPEGARVVCFHGVPKPKDVSHPWALEHWRE
jgi:hypothetical protein